MSGQGKKVPTPRGGRGTRKRRRGAVYFYPAWPCLLVYKPYTVLFTHASRPEVPKGHLSHVGEPLSGPRAGPAGSLGGEDGGVWPGPRPLHPGLGWSGVGLGQCGLDSPKIISTSSGGLELVTKRIMLSRAPVMYKSMRIIY